MGRRFKGAWILRCMAVGCLKCSVWMHTGIYPTRVERRTVRRCRLSALQRQAVARRLTWERNSCMPAKTTIQAEMPKDGQGLWQ